MYFDAVIASRAKQSRRDCRVALRAPRNDKTFQLMQRIYAIRDGPKLVAYLRAQLAGLLG
jgi:hypothetical protein